MDEAFKKWVKFRKTKNGYIAKCKKGFWSVHAPTYEEAEREARHYFAQYYSDGEYA